MISSLIFEQGYNLDHSEVFLRYSFLFWSGEGLVDDFADLKKYTYFFNI